MKEIILSNIKIIGLPKVQIREFFNSDSKLDILDKVKRPLITTRKIFLSFKLNHERYLFPIQKNFKYDGATIIKIFWILIGYPLDIKFIQASLVHDYFLNNRAEIYPLYFKGKLSINNYIDMTTQLFVEILIQNHVPYLKSKLMGLLISQWQKSIFNKKKWQYKENSYDKHHII